MYSNFTTAIRDAIDEYELLKSENDRLRRRIEQYQKDREIQLLNEEIHRIRRNSIVLLTDVEFERLQNFKAHHLEKCHHKSHFVFDLHSSNIGTIIEVQCPCCGEIQNITDYDSM